MNAPHASRVFVLVCMSHAFRGNGLSVETQTSAGAHRQSLHAYATDRSAAVRLTTLSCVIALVALPACARSAPGRGSAPDFPTPGAMAGWGDVFEPSPAEEGTGDTGWADVFEAVPSPASGGWDGLFGEGGPAEESPQDGWSGVFSDVADDESDASDACEGLVPVGAAVAEAAGEKPPPKTTVDVAREVKFRLRSDAVAHDGGELGRCLSMVAALPADASLRGRVALFSQSTEEVAKQLMQTEDVRAQTAISAQAGVAGKRVASTKTRLGCALVHLTNCAARTALEQLTECVVGAGGSCVSFTFRSRYDETPLKLRSNSADDDGVAGKDIGAKLRIATDTAFAKIVQAEMACLCLFKLGGHFEAVSFSLPMWLQNVERTSAEEYLRLCRLVDPGFGRLIDRFSRVQRLVTTDGAAAIAKAERAYAQERPQQAVMHLVCEVHRVSHIGKRFDELMPQDVGNMVHLARSLHQPGAMKRFRAILRLEIAASLEIRHGSPGPDADQRREAILDLFCPIVPGQGKSLFKRRVVAALANGDYSVRGRFQHFCRGCCRGREDTVYKLTTLYCNLVARSACPVFPRSRWTRSELTMQWLGLLAMTHNLLSVVYTKWAAELGTKVSERQPRQFELVPLEDAGALDLVGGADALAQALVVDPQVGATMDDSGNWRLSGGRC